MGVFVCYIANSACIMSRESIETSVHELQGSRYIALLKNMRTFMMRKPPFLGALIPVDKNAAGRNSLWNCIFESHTHAGHGESMLELTVPSARI